MFGGDCKHLEQASEEKREKKKKNQAGKETRIHTCNVFALEEKKVMKIRKKSRLQEMVGKEGRGEGRKRRIQRGLRNHSFLLIPMKLTVKAKESLTPKEKSE